MGQLYVERQVEMNRSADQVWEYMSDLRRAMTLDQFHISVDCDSADAANPRTGLTVPILHRILGYDQIRLARITKYGDYEIGWGERTPQGEVDAFPHSEGWKIEDIGSKTCLVTLWMRGQWRTPVGAMIQQYLWDNVIIPALDQDMADLAQKVGAGTSRPPEPVPDEAGQLLSLAFAQTIDGVPAQEFFDRVPPLFPDKTDAGARGLAAADGV